MALATVPLYCQCTVHVAREGLQCFKNTDGIVTELYCCVMQMKQTGRYVVLLVGLLQLRYICEAVATSSVVVLPEVQRQALDGS